MAGVASLQWVMATPLSVPPGCPIGWQPNALAPVFYGYREYAPADGAPRRLRMYFPSIEGSSGFVAPLAGCGRYPLILFLHGKCLGDTFHFRRWGLLASQLARSGYVVAVPDVGWGQDDYPWDTNRPHYQQMRLVHEWAGQSWEYQELLMPGVAGVAGHSYGGLLAGRLLQTSDFGCYAALSAGWGEWPGSNWPILGSNKPKLLVWGGGANDFTAPIPPHRWNPMPPPKHRASFTEGLHFDYLAAGQSPCDPERGPCGPLRGAAADLLIMFFARYLPPELTPQLPGQIPANLTPPALNLTPEQEFYAGGHLIGFPQLPNTPGCGFSLGYGLPQRTVPDVRELSRSAADQAVRAAGLVPNFSGPTGPGGWVHSQSPQAGTQVDIGSTVNVVIRTGPRP
jgi:PASTA domain-containing protein